MSSAATEPKPKRSKLDRSRLIGAGVMCGMGLLHFAVPRPFDGIIPSWVPGSPRTWTYLSGIAELGAGGLMLNKRTSQLGAGLAATTFAAVWPANIQMAIDNPPTSAWGVALTLRVPLQLPMFAWAFKHFRAAPRRAPEELERNLSAKVGIGVA